MQSSVLRTLRPYVCSSCQWQLLRTKRRRFASTSNPAPEIYDLATVGGGPVGLALLAALSEYAYTSEGPIIDKDRILARHVSLESGID